MNILLFFRIRMRGGKRMSDLSKGSGGQTHVIEIKKKGLANNLKNSEWYWSWLVILIEGGDYAIMAISSFRIKYYLANIYRQ